MNDQTECAGAATLPDCGLQCEEGDGLFCGGDCPWWKASHGKENTMNNRTQRVLGAADSARQGIELARSLIQGCLGSTGEILTQGCMELGEASLGSTMRLGQKFKEFSFLLDDLLKDAHGLCVLLGKDLGVCEDETKTLGDMVEALDSWIDSSGEVLGIEEPDLTPGEGEFDDDEQPF